MSVAHDVPTLRAPSLGAALGQLRARGMRVSAARRQILEALYAADGPLSAEALAVADLDVASVYRNLAVLEELGLVRHVHVGHGPGLYSVAPTGFAACERCGAFLALEPDRLAPVRALIERELGYVARFTHFPIVGICPTCKESSQHAHS